MNPVCRMQFNFSRFKCVGSPYESDSCQEEDFGDWSAQFSSAANEPDRCRRGAVCLFVDAHQSADNRTDVHLLTPRDFSTRTIYSLKKYIIRTLSDPRTPHSVYIRCTCIFRSPPWPSLRTFSCSYVAHIIFPTIVFFQIFKCWKINFKLISFKLWLVWRGGYFFKNKINLLGTKLKVF